MTRSRQIAMFPPPPADEDAELNAAQAAMRLERMARDATRPTAHELPRWRRRRAVRARSINVKRLARRDLELGRALYPAEELDDVTRPRTRAECADGPRPCPFVSCRHHLYLDVHANGSIKLNFPDVEPDRLEELPETCALDVAGQDGVALERAGALLNLTRERVRQLERVALARLAAREAVRDVSELRDHVAPRRRLPVLEDAGDAFGDD